MRLPAIVLLVFIFLGAISISVAAPTALNPLLQASAEKYNIPLPLMIALANLGSGFEDRGDKPSVMNGYGIMGLKKNDVGGQALTLGATLTGKSEDTVKTDAAANIEAAAAVLDYYARMNQIDRTKGLEAWTDVITTYAGLDASSSKIYAYETFAYLRNGFDYVNSTGEQFHISPQEIGSVDMPNLQHGGWAVQTTNVDYPGAIYAPATSCNYDTGLHGNDTIVIHVVEGTGADCVSWFTTCNRDRFNSSHYVVGEDGTVWQCVPEYQDAWHAVCANGRAVGIEHGGWIAQTSFPTVQYQGSAALVRDICNRWGIPKSHTGVWGGIMGHSEVCQYCACNPDPGSGWNWSYYISQVTANAPKDTVYVEPRGQNGAWFSDDGTGWGNSGGWCNSFDSGLTSGGSRYFPASTAGATGRWVQVSPTLNVAGGTYQVLVSHYDNTLISDDLVVSTSLTNCTSPSGDLHTGSTNAFQYQRGCQWRNIGNIVLNAGQTQPTIRFTYQSGNVADSNNRWNVQGFKFLHVPTSSTLTLNASSGGTVGGGGGKNSGDSVTATATPNSGYRFVSWTTGGFNGTVVSTSASYSFVMPAQGYTLYANFITNGTLLTATPCPAAGGATTGTNGYNPGQSVTVTATPAAGYTWGNWTTGSCGGTVVSTSQSYTFTMPATATTVYANFVPSNFTLTATTCYGGNVTGSGTYATDQPVTVTATPSAGCVFTGWTTDSCGGSAVVSTSASYTFNMPPNNYTLYANFTHCLLSEGFESYNTGGTNSDSIDKNDTSGPNQAANGSGNPWWGPGPPNGRIDTGVKHSGSKSLFGTQGNGKDCYNLAYRLNGGSAFTSNVYMDWWFYDPIGSAGNTTSFDNDFACLSYYSGIPSGTDYPSPVPNPLTGNIQQTAIGMSNDWSSGYSASYYQVHVTGDSGGYANGWYNTSVTRSVGWHRARIIVGPRKASNTNDITFYIDNMAAPVLTKDSTTTAGYNVIEFNTLLPKSGMVFSSPLHWNNYDDLSFGKISDAPGSAAATATGADRIAWSWTDTSSVEDGFAVTDSTGSVKATAGAGMTTATETGLVANTQYSRFAASFVTVAGGKLTSSQVALPPTYTLATAPVYALSGNGAVYCGSGPGSATTRRALGSTIAFMPMNQFGTGPAKASKYIYIWDTTPGEPSWASPLEWKIGNLPITPSVPGAYYLHLRACNADGAANPATLTLGPYIISQDLDRIPDAWGIDDGVLITLTGKAVSAAYAGAEFWIQETDCPAAMRVTYPGTLAAWQDHSVTVTGTLDSSSRPRALVASIVQDLGAASPLVKPLGTSLRSTSCSAFNTRTLGPTSGKGLYTLGLLVKVAGSVVAYDNTTDPNNKYFYLDDGSQMPVPPDMQPPVRVKVKCGSTDAPTSGYVTVVGVVSAEPAGLDFLPVLISRPSSP